jgi:hypothetical protein
MSADLVSEHVRTHRHTWDVLDLTGPNFSLFSVNAELFAMATITEKHNIAITGGMLWGGKKG